MRLHAICLGGPVPSGGGATRADKRSWEGERRTSVRTSGSRPPTQWRDERPLEAAADDCRTPHLLRGTRDEASGALKEQAADFTPQK